MKIHYFFGEPWEEAYVRTRLPREDIVFHKGFVAAFPNLTDPEAEVLCFMEGRIGEAELKRFPQLKFIATRSTGFDLHRPRGGESARRHSGQCPLIRRRDRR